MTDRVIGLGLAVLGVVIVILSLRLPQPLAATRITYGPGFFPTILGGIVVVCGLVMAVMKPAPDSATDPGAGQGQPRLEPAQLVRPAVVVAAALVYILFSAQIGFLILTPIILTGLLLLGGVSLRQSLLIGVPGSIVIYVLFAKLLLVPLPLGLLTPFGAHL